jgi:hypothetical protein
MMKKLFGIFIVLFCSTAANAQFSGGNGTESSPYIITTAAELAQLATYVNNGDTNYNDKNYKLGNDIDLTEYLSETGAGYNDGKGWIPIGWYDLSWINQPFSGIFDGNNYKIFGIKADNVNIGRTGLFGYILNATVKNLGVENINIKAGCFVGGIVGNCEDSNIINCYSTGSISNNYPSQYNNGVGGIIGRCVNSIILSCNSTCVVSINSSVPACAGGIVAYSYWSEVLNCNSSALVNSISTSSSIVGGVVGENSSGIVSNCSSTGSVSNIANSCYAGGVVGTNAYGSVSNCFSLGTVIGADNGSSLSTVYSGGVVGNSFGGGKISNCYSTGSVSGKGFWGFVGGIVGQNSPNVSNCMALCPDLVGSYIASANFFGRIVGDGGNTHNNIAYEDMINPEGNTIWYNIGTSNKDGEDISCEEILADGTFGGRFTSEGGWTTQNGKLPGLFGNTVDLPEHLCSSVYPPVITSNILSDGTVEIEYSNSITADGNVPMVWSIETGNLPDGLHLFDTGEISGTPTTEGTFNFIVKAMNNYGFDTKAFSITIKPLENHPIIVSNDGNGTASANVSTATMGTEITLTATPNENYKFAEWKIISGGIIITTPTISPATFIMPNNTVEVMATFTEDVGITETEIETIKVYPNPTGGELRIESSRFKVQSIEVFDIFGKKVLISSVRFMAPETVINISHLQAGVYFLKISTEVGQVIKKVLRE